MFYSCFCVCCSSLAKLLSCSDVDCVVEAILLLMLSLVDSDTFRCRDRAASTLHTIALVGICFGVAERSVRITVASFNFVSGMGKMSSFRSVSFVSVFHCSRFSFCWCPVPTITKENQLLETPDRRMHGRIILSHASSFDILKSVLVLGLELEEKY